MQILIDIPEIAYNLLKSDAPIEIDWLDAENILNRIAEGIVLPKGHGRLIDADAVLEEPIGDTYRDIDIAETIIEADKEGE